MPCFKFTCKRPVLKPRKKLKENIQMLIFKPSYLANLGIFVLTRFIANLSKYQNNECLLWKDNWRNVIFLVLHFIIFCRITPCFFLKKFYKILKCWFLCLSRRLLFVHRLISFMSLCPMQISLVNIRMTNHPLLLALIPLSKFNISLGKPSMQYCLQIS